MNDSFSTLELGTVLLLACIVAMASRRVNVPYSVGLLLAGLLLALLPMQINLPLSRDLIFNVFLPPLVFQAAVEIRWDHFRQNLPLTLLLAFPGVAISSAIVASGAHFLLHWSWLGAAIFGVLIAATDPVAVIATFKQLKTDARLRLLVESESLLNDGVAAVGFGVLVGIAHGGGGSFGAIATNLAITVAGGIGCGLAMAGGLLLIAGRTDDHLVEITLTTLAAYGSFLLAEHLGMSGVLASLSAGLLVGNAGWRGAISKEGRGHVLAFWEYAAFLANSIIFILIGGHEAQQPLAILSGAVAVAVLLVFVARALTVYPLAKLVAHTPLRIDRRYQHVLFWGGLRGAMALALALSLPFEIAERDEIIAVSFLVVGFSILTQGTTMPWLVRRLRLVRQDNRPEVEDG